MCPLEYWGYTCVPLEVTRETRPLACLILVSFLKLRKERRKQTTSRGGGGGVPFWVTHVYPQTGPIKADGSNRTDQTGPIKPDRGLRTPFAHDRHALAPEKAEAGP